MTPLAQRLGLTVLLAVSVASLVLSTFMIFTLRLLAASVAEVCPPGGGCEIPSWVGGINIAEKEWWWARIKEQRYIQITTRWLPLTYACIGYSALALLYIALYGYTHTVSRAKTKWTAVGYDVVLQLGFGACGIVIAALHLLVEWMYGRFFWNHLQQKTNWSRYSENIFAPRVCGDLGTYCARFHSSMGTLIALGALFVLAAVAQLYYVVHRRASWSDSLVSIDKLRAESGRKVTDSSGNHLELRISRQ
ncbi:hypothetical protein CC85DRAFT_303218 [Cutaneotrichosporon oleaginosum]|uniref:Uncharacterized protein n=1 Tax=Cutaneotrichosporon oleaginosum TaxID=879819 RepID=A0A0J0XK04_9TREE|nr:uncharacterized protein CC85DRAFT_303218 [Cutaneotrichosporon oleaginosum]KLT41418.1 hypothetical protein CC85DRAFT_303218 [Cutaneotrichosporon oleaginosum]TXT12181.1 hypothetical protein COLE_02591 [Cutaneotrichosporon oleaginosum]